MPEGSALADWPITYEDLAPYYREVEWEFGVAGDADGDYPHFPSVPAVAEDRAALGRRRPLGWSTTRVPLLINTERATAAGLRALRSCVGFPCPVDAKNGSDVTALPRAVALGAHLVAGAQVTRIDDDGT